jgi:hypothetical protein
MMSGFSPLGSRTSLRAVVLSGVASGSMSKRPSPGAIGGAATWASDSSAQAGSQRAEETYSRLSPFELRLIEPKHL